MTSVYCALLFCTNLHLTDCRQPVVGYMSGQELADKMVDAAVLGKETTWNACAPDKAWVDKQPREIVNHNVRHWR